MFTVFCCGMRRMLVNGALLCGRCDSPEKVPNIGKALAPPDGCKKIDMRPSDA